MDRPGGDYGWIGFATVTTMASGGLLPAAQRTIPMGTTCAAWTGTGAVGTFVLGVLVFREPATFTRFFFVGLIVAGILGLKVSSTR